MSKEKKDTLTLKETETNSNKLTVEQLFTSKRFSGVYQYDFSKAILGNNLYSPSEAEEILNKFFNKKKGDK